MRVAVERDGVDTGVGFENRRKEGDEHVGLLDIEQGIDEEREREMEKNS